MGSAEEESRDAAIVVEPRGSIEREANFSGGGFGVVIASSLLFGTAIGLLAGHFAGSLAGGTFLGFVGGSILAWGIRKGAVLAAVRGAILGGLFAFLIGPLADSLISGAPITEKLLLSLVAGILLGSLLGVRNFRVKRKK